MTDHRHLALKALEEAQDGGYLTAHLAEAQVHALLYVGDEIRARKGEPPTADEIAQDLKSDYLREAVDGAAGTLSELGATLDGIRTEIADLRATVQRYGTIR